MTRTKPTTEWTLPRYDSLVPFEDVNGVQIQDVNGVDIQVIGTGGDLTPKIQTTWS